MDQTLRLQPAAVTGSQQEMMQPQVERVLFTEPVFLFLFLCVAYFLFQKQ